jgi:hypothetical protein
MANSTNIAIVPKVTVTWQLCFAFIFITGPALDPKRIGFFTFYWFSGNNSKDYDTKIVINPFDVRGHLCWPLNIVA